MNKVLIDKIIYYYNTKTIKENTLLLIVTIKYEFIFKFKSHSI